MDVSPLISALTDPQSELRERYASMVVDRWLQANVSSLVPSAASLSIARAGLRDAALEALFSEHVTPIVERIREQLAESGESIGAWVSPTAQQGIERLLSNPNGPRFTYFSSAVDPTLMRRLLSPVFQDVLLRFVAKIPAVITGGGGGSSAPSGSSSGLLGRLGREMGGRGKLLVDVGRSVVGNLGLEEKLQPVAADFSQQAVGAFRESLSERLKSKEGRQLVQQLVTQGTENVLKVSLADVNRDLSAIPLAEALALLPEAVAYAAQRELFGTLLENEINRFYERFGDGSVEELLKAHHLYDEARATLQDAAQAHAKQMFEAPEFATWLIDLLSILPQ